MIDIKGMQELKRNLEQFKKETNQILINAVYHGNVLIQNDAKANHPDVPREVKTRYADRTENLTNSILALQPEAKGESIIGYTGAFTEYAYYVECLYPYMFPALEANSRLIYDHIHRMLNTIRWINK